jgi:hypothetical protein
MNKRDLLVFLRAHEFFNQAEWRVKDGLLTSRAMYDPQYSTTTIQHTSIPVLDEMCSDGTFGVITSDVKGLINELRFMGDRVALSIKQDDEQLYEVNYKGINILAPIGSHHFIVSDEKPKHTIPLLLPKYVSGIRELKAEPDYDTAVVLPRGEQARKLRGVARQAHDLVFFPNGKMQFRVNSYYREPHLLTIDIAMTGNLSRPFGVDPGIARHILTLTKDYGSILRISEKGLAHVHYEKRD